VNGVRHRVDGPAVLWVNERMKLWYQDGKLHRVDGPAGVYSGNGKLYSWHRNGVRHRVDGPAVLWVNGAKEWWVNGVRVAFRTAQQNRNTV
jgi:hypothetical protein